MLPGKKILACGSHPDDLEFGVFGTLLRVTRESSAKVFCYVGSVGGIGDQTSGPQRKEESGKVLGMLNNNVVFWNDRIGLGDYPETVKEIDYLVDSCSIDLILSPSIHDTHQDHRMLSEVCVTALRRHRASILFYQLPSTTQKFKPQIYVDISKYYQTKKQFLRDHLSQKDKQYMTDEYLEIFNSDSHAFLRGFRYVEKFDVGRCFI